MTKVEKTLSNFLQAYPHFPQGAIQWTCILWAVFQVFVGFIRLTSKLKNDCITHSKVISNKQLSQKIGPNQLFPLELQRKVVTRILWVVYTLSDVNLTGIFNQVKIQNYEINPGEVNFRLKTCFRTFSFCPTFQFSSFCFKPR